MKHLLTVLVILVLSGCNTNPPKEKEKEEEPKVTKKEKNTKSKNTIAKQIFFMNLLHGSENHDPLSPYMEPSWDNTWDRKYSPAKIDMGKVNKFSASYISPENTKPSARVRCRAIIRWEPPKGIYKYLYLLTNDLVKGERTKWAIRDITNKKEYRYQFTDGNFDYLMYSHSLVIIIATNKKYEARRATRKKAGSYLLELPKAKYYSKMILVDFIR